MLTMSLGQDRAIKGTLSFPRVTTKFALSISFSLACPIVSEVRGFLGKPRLNRGNFY